MQIFKKLNFEHQKTKNMQIISVPDNKGFFFKLRINLKIDEHFIQLNQKKNLQINIFKACSKTGSEFSMTEKGIKKRDFLTCQSNIVDIPFSLYFSRMD